MLLRVLQKLILMRTWPCLQILRRIPGPNEVLPPLKLGIDECIRIIVP